MPVTIVGNNTPTAGGVVYGDGTNYASTAAGTSGQVLQSNGAGAPTWGAGATSVYSTVNGRLTLTTATPVTTSAVTAATTIYFTPYLGNQIGTYSGTAWSVNTFTEKSVAVPSTTSTPFDVFIVDGTLALETVNWTNDTTRATALVLQDGIYVKSGATTRRYLGTCRTTTVSGQCEDSLQRRFVWNYYNRVSRTMQTPTQSGGASWTYTTNTMRQANGSAANQVDFVIGIDETPVLANLIVGVRNSSGNVNLAATIGLDSTTSNSSQTTFLTYWTGAGNDILLLTAQYNGYTGIGRHYLAWLEVSQAIGTTTWIGNTSGIGLSLNGSNTGFLSGITATITC